MDSKGSPFFKQKRVGKDGLLFFMFKLRSMENNAEKLGPYFTQKNDPRITRVGKLLRKTSLDEVPQIFNVLCGQMSFIGPRPNSPIQESFYTELQWKKRHSIRPGITGLSQCMKRSLATHEERVTLDLEYVDRVSFVLDMTIIIKTIKIIFLKKYAN